MTSMRSLAMLVVVGTLDCPPAFADDACAAFKWPLSREQSWFRDPHPAIASGASLAKADGAATIRLRPVGEITFAVPPDHKPAAGTYAAVIAVPAVDQGGLYQITLSDEAWIDVVQDGAPRKSVDFSGKTGCPGLRKSVRFDLAAAPITIQVSGAKAEAIELAVGPVH